MKECYQRHWDKRMMPTTAGVSKRTYIILNMTDNQERDNFYHNSYVYKGFISAVSLLNDLIKILVDLGIFNCVIFKNFGSAKIGFLNKQTNIGQ